MVSPDKDLAGYPANETGYSANETRYPANQTRYTANQTGYAANKTGYPANRPGYPGQLYMFSGSERLRRPTFLERYTFRTLEFGTISPGTLFRLSW